MSERDRIREDGEPLYTERRCAQKSGTGEAIETNIPAKARDLMSIRPGDELEVDIFEDRLVYRPASVATDGGGGDDG